MMANCLSHPRSDRFSAVTRQVHEPFHFRVKGRRGRQAVACMSLSAHLMPNPQNLRELSRVTPRLSNLETLYDLQQPTDGLLLASTIVQGFFLLRRGG